MKGPTRSTSYWQWCNGIVERLKNSSGKRRRRTDHQRGLERKKKSKIKKVERNFKTGGDNIGLIGLNKLHSEIFRFSHLSTYSTHSTQSILPTVKGDLACIALRTLNSTMLSQVMLRSYGMDVTSIPGFWTNYPATSYKWLSQCIADKSDSLDNELGPLKGITGSTLPTM